MAFGEVGHSRYHLYSFLHTLQRYVLEGAVKVVTSREEPNTGETPLTQVNREITASYGSGQGLDSQGDHSPRG